MAISQFKATTTDLLNSITSRGLVPTNQNTYTQAQILQLADEELQIGLLPLVISTQEEYYATYKDYPVFATAYTLPERAVGGKLRALVLVDSAGNEQPIMRIEFEDIPYQFDMGYYFRGNEIVFTRAPTSTVRMYYHTRPSHLILTSECGLVATVGATSVDLSSVPATFATTATYDVVSSTAPCKVRALDISVSSFVGVTANFPALPVVAVGDYLCLSGQSPCIQLPYELIPILAQRVAVKVLEGIGDVDGMKRAQEKLHEMEPRAFRLLEPRVDSQPHKVLNRNSVIRSYGRNKTTY